MLTRVNIWTENPENMLTARKSVKENGQCGINGGGKNIPLLGVFLGVVTYKWYKVEWTPLLTTFRAKHVEYVE